MSLILSGYAGNVTTPLTATITAIADNGSGAWRVQTSTPHLFGSLANRLGDFVHLVINGGALAGADFYAFVIVIDSTHFDVPSATYTSGTGTGTATDLSITPQFLVPTDGDSFSLQISGMLSALQCLSDRTQYLQHTKPQSLTAFLPSPDPWNEPYPGGSGFQDTGIHLDFTLTNVGDIITAWFSGQIDVVGSGQLRIATRDDFANANVLASSITQTWTSNTTAQPFSFMARHVVTNAGTTRIVVQLNESGMNTIAIGGVGSMLVRRDRG